MALLWAVAVAAGAVEADHKAHVKHEKAREKAAAHLEERAALADDRPAPGLARPPLCEEESQEQGELAARRTGSSTRALAGALIRPLTRPRATPCAASELRATRSSSAARALLAQKAKAVRTPCCRWQSSNAALSSASSRDATPPPPPASPSATRLEAGCGASPYASASFVRSVVLSSGT